MDPGGINTAFAKLFHILIIKFTTIDRLLFAQKCGNVIEFC